MEKLNYKDFKAMIKSGAANLENHAAEVDTLNVFPVPDGDTGTNMSMTFTNGYLEANKCNSESVSDIAKALSKGLLMGARGNSGVITSQIFRGFYQSIEGKNELTASDISIAFENGARVAYKAIMKPVEGTILTVIREASWYANHDMESKQMDIVEYFERLYKYSQESVDRTPELLPVLKEVGVVDSGGTGLLRIIEGFLFSVKGQAVEFEDKKDTNVSSPLTMIENDEFGYCTEFILRLNDDYVNIFDENRLKQKLTDMGGESLVVVKDDDLVKVHVHTLKPGDMLNIGQRYGEFVKLKIENMQEQHSTIMANASSDNKVDKPKKKYGLIAVGAGKGIVDTFKELGVDVVVEGGQTMNPSTEDFIKKVNELDNCENILIFPNNSNIILAANQTKDILSDKKIYVIETKSIQEGISAISMFDESLEIEDNIETMTDTIKSVYAASVTYAIKDTTFEGVKVKQGDYIAIAGKKIISSNKDREKVMFELLDNLFEMEDKAVLTLIAGEDVNASELAHIEKYVKDNSDLELSIMQGDQPVYSYLVSVE